MRFDIYVYSDLGMVEDCKIQLFTVAILYSKCFIYNIYCNFKDLKRLSMASYENDTHYYQKSFLVWHVMKQFFKIIRLKSSGDYLDE